MKRAITILTCVLTAGVAVAQNPQIIQNTKALMDGVQSNATRASNQALGISKSPAPTASKSVAKPSAATTSAAPKASVAKPVAATKSSVAPKVTPAVVRTAKPAPKAVKVVPVVAKVAPKPAPAAPSATPDATKEPNKAEQKWAMTGKRDPFVSPVVYSTGVSNCTGGKKCLEIGSINLKGVVHSDNGFIAVVTNNLNKAYFLRENDPLFDGYVVKITGDSIVFQETLQDRLGKSFTKEVVKKLTTPAV